MRDILVATEPEARAYYRELDEKTAAELFDKAVAPEPVQQGSIADLF